MQFLSYVVFLVGAFIQMDSVARAVPSNIQKPCALALIALWGLIFYGVKRRRNAWVRLMVIGVVSITLTIMVELGAGQLLDWLRHGGRIYGFPVIKFVSEFWDYLLLLLLLTLFAFFVSVWAWQLAVLLWKKVKSHRRRGAGP